MTKVEGFPDELHLSLENGFLPNGERGIVIRIKHLKQQVELAVVLPVYHAEMLNEQMAKMIYDQTKVPQWIKQ